MFSPTVQVKSTWTESFFQLGLNLWWILTGGLCALAQLKLNATEELSGDQTVGYNHHHSWDEEQSEQQQHIPGKTARMERETCKNNTQKEGERKNLNLSWIGPQNQPTLWSHQAIFLFPVHLCAYVGAVLEALQMVDPSQQPSLSPWCLAKGALHAGYQAPQHPEVLTCVYVYHWEHFADGMFASIYNGYLFAAS